MEACRLGVMDTLIKEWKKIFKGTIAEGYCCPYCGKRGYEWEDRCEYCGKEVLPVKEKNGRKNFCK